MIDPRGLARRLDEVRRSYAGAGIEVVSLAEHAALLIELAAFADCMDATGREARSPGGANTNHRIPEASEELEAIVLGTAAATDAILSTCEQLDYAVAHLPEACRGPVQRATARIFEACSFQDITGQRIAKVGQVLKLIDCNVPIVETAITAVPPSPHLQSRSSLLNGPQTGSRGMNQGAVDALFGSSV